MPTKNVRVNKRVRRGFTLMELLLVLVILGVLAALIVPRFAGRSQQAREQAAKTDVNSLKTAIGNFEIEVGRYPSSSEGFDALLKAPSGAEGWNGPYLDKTGMKDPWGNPYAYKYPGQQNPDGFDVYSFGPDGRDGGDDDIGNW